MDTAYQGFLGLRTTFDIFQNILILCVEYGVWISSGYSLLNFESLWFLVKYRNKYAVSSLMDTAYWMPEQLRGLETKEKSPKVEKPTNEEIVKEFGLKSLGDILLDEFGGAYAKLNTDESPFDTES
ncbi:hypothetical protein Tco_1426268 [Tanacetum coccineum]